MLSGDAKHQAVLAALASRSERSACALEALRFGPDSATSQNGCPLALLVVHHLLLPVTRGYSHAILRGWQQAVPCCDRMEKENRQTEDRF